MRTTRPKDCAQCGSARWLPIAYGYPGPGMFEAVERGELVLGGCIVSEESPKWRCVQCGYEPGRPLAWTGRDGPRNGEFADFHRVLTTSAIPGEGASPSEVSRFALSFDGYAAFGGEQSRALGRGAQDEFRESGQLPGNVAALRNALFFVQRKAHHTDAPMPGDYVSALLDALRAELVIGTDMTCRSTSI